MIPVSRPYLPDRSRLNKYIDRIYSSCCLTNNGELLKELTLRLEEYLGVTNLLLVGNGTLALQVAYRALGLGRDGERASEAITTPFSFIATSSSLKWEGVQPVFADIDSETWCLDPGQVERNINERTVGLVPVHVFGNGCDIEALDRIAKHHGLKVIYDGAHAFGVKFKGRSILQHGDATTLSFHATKLFHTIEGGAIIFRHRDSLDKAKLMINFGLSEDSSIVSLGINCKMNEFQAAMGLCVLDDIGTIIASRMEICSQYQRSLEGWVGFQRHNPSCTKNYAYFPVLFDNEAELIKVKKALEERGFFPRRYFYPSLESVSHIAAFDTIQEKSRRVSEQVLCLPVFPGLSMAEVELVCELIKKCVSRTS
ncbi:DegT/DnrJ/EryC1/StrS family aminotransferase [Halomonas rhizosphaerae]|uniref:DegT/DnrJ/EryC1/StrS family aminotransferase n=1 Tax=Halomonas rhizosphaerae TaxID=3043296 RepID=A0ABT6V0X7_9GAMM|nr:DegT/DnrJ/EryC1/StrS family aminotransferase [Halomonas rhizosphaerae]MDI5891885.1 DegT/DnrJ/EryC1/StrS family aminotransferase [Halomonas rhizosphaerae]